jgi:hypothetical protein
VPTLDAVDGARAPGARSDPRAASTTPEIAEALHLSDNDDPQPRQQPVLEDAGERAGNRAIVLAREAGFGADPAAPGTLR